jgi:hypothetical protein
MKNWFKTLLIILILTIFSLVAYPGYGVFAEDHFIDIPALYAQLNHALFTRDLVSSVNQTKFSLFNQFVAGFMNLFRTNIFTSLFLLDFLTRLIAIYSFYEIGLYFTGSGFLSFIFAFLASTGLSVYGTPTSTFDIRLVPRTISLPLALLGTVFIFRKQLLFAAPVLGLSLIFHPLTAAPFLAFFYAELLFFSGRSFSKKFLLGILPLIFLTLLVSGMPANQLGIFTRVDAAWEAIMRVQTPELFITSWLGRGVYLQLLATAIIFFLGLFKLKNYFSKENIRYFYLLFFISLLAFLVAFIGADILKLHLIIELQLTRALIMWRLVDLLILLLWINKSFSEKENLFCSFLLVGLTAAFVLRENFMYIFLPPLILDFILGFIPRYKQKFQYFVYSLFLLSLAIFLGLLFFKGRVGSLYYFYWIIGISAAIILAVAFWGWDKFLSKKTFILFLTVLIIFIIILLPKFTIKPAYLNDENFSELCAWVKNNTPTSAMFIVAPFSSSGEQFRISCLKNIFFSKIDGIQSFFDRDYAMEWQKRLDLISKINQNPDYLKNVVREYDINYILSERKLHLNNPPVFSNNRYFVYKLDNQQ